MRKRVLEHKIHSIGATKARPSDVRVNSHTMESSSDYTAANAPKRRTSCPVSSVKYMIASDFVNLNYGAIAFRI